MVAIDGFQYFSTINLSVCGARRVILEAINDKSLLPLSNYFFNLNFLVQIDCNDVDYVMANKDATFMVVFPKPVSC